MPFSRECFQVSQVKLAPSSLSSLDLGGVHGARTDTRKRSSSKRQQRQHRTDEIKARNNKTRGKSSCSLRDVHDNDDGGDDDALHSTFLVPSPCSTCLFETFIISSRISHIPDPRCTFVSRPPDRIVSCYDEIMMARALESLKVK